MIQHDLAVENLQAEIPGIMDAFMKLHDEVLKEGALSIKLKRLMLVAISIVLRCEPCLQAHVGGAITAGASRKEISEAVGVGVLMSGGPAMAFSATSLIELLENSGLKNEVSTSVSTS
jgi:AhpD family alkylhydroperoxidase